MLLDEDPATLIHQCTTNFNLAPDRAALSRITSSLSTLHATRSHTLSTNRAALSRSTRTLSALRAAHSDATRQTSDENGVMVGRSSDSHSAAILALDREKFRVAKALSELEIEGERLASELDSARGKLADVEAVGVEEGGEGVAMGGEGAEDEVVLKLKVYRGLGIDVERSGAVGEDGVYNKAVIRCGERGDVRVVNVDRKFSRYFYANYFWGSM